MVTVPSTCSVDDVKVAAKRKHMLIDQSFPDINYTLLYPDGSKVNTIPDSNMAFTPQRYKEFLKIQFLRLKLYLCPELDYLSG